MKHLLVIALCIVAVWAVGERCRNGDDCAEDECCVNYVLITSFGGRCQKTRKEGETCTPLKKKGEDSPDMYHFQCPCIEGLECISKGDVEIFGHIIRGKPQCVVSGNEDEDGGEIPEPEAE